MKKIILAVAMVVMMVSVASAEPSGSLSSTTAAKYVGGAGTNFYNAPVQQTDLFIILPHGFYVDFWNSLPINGKDNFGKEVDWTIGWSGKIAESGLKADIGISYYDFIGLFESSGDAINPYAKITKEFSVVAKDQTLAVYVKIETPFAASGNSPKSGVRTYLGFIHAWQMSKNASVFQEAYAVYDNGAYGKDGGIIGAYKACANMALSQRFSLGISLVATSPLASMRDGRKTQVVPAVGVTYKF